MQFVNIHDAKTNLSKYLEQILSTHDDIVICKRGKPIAKLTEYVPTGKSKLGLWRNQVKISEAFDKLPDVLRKE